MEMDEWNIVVCLAFLLFVSDRMKNLFNWNGKCFVFNDGICQHVLNSISNFCFSFFFLLIRLW